MKYSLFISCAKGLEYLLETEMQSLGLNVQKVSPQGVYGQASLTELYNICLWSRLANRVHLLLFSGLAHEERSLYQSCYEFHWQTVFSVDKTLNIEFHGHSKQIRNSMFGAQVIKDAIVDHFRKLTGKRPSIAKENPNIRIHAYLKDDQVSLSLDLCGFSLHQRGYRQEAGEAPLKETLAAALLLRAKWPILAQQGYGFYDPFCGAGTLLIEAAMMAAHIAPGLLRNDHALDAWVENQAGLWAKLRAQALSEVKPIKLKLYGGDVNATLIEKAKANATRAGVLPMLELSCQDFRQARANTSQGLIICNPPYGQRLSEVAKLGSLYKNLGSLFHHEFQGWQAAVLTAEPRLAKAIGLRAGKSYTVFNGAIECKLYCFSLNDSNRLNLNPNLSRINSASAIEKKGVTAKLGSPSLTEKRLTSALSQNAAEGKVLDSMTKFIGSQDLSFDALSSGARMLFNRLKKNQEHLQKWAKRAGIDCYRLYDADLPEYAFAIDRYAGFEGETFAAYFLLQEYKAPAYMEASKIEERRKEAIQALLLALDLEPKQLIIKERRRQKGLDQYERLGKTGHSLIVKEGRARLKVNLHDYIDTGLFLDHRPLRLSFAKLKPGTRFLNCFSYTGTASVHAALAGALTTNVDLSNTYLTWAQDNFRLNHIDLSRHQFVDFDCLEWLKLSRDTFDVIFLDPPSFSNSKSMDKTLDLQRDHLELIQAAMKRLHPAGLLYFSTNLRRFKLAAELSELSDIQDITPKTLDLDFKRNERIHRCYVFQNKHA